MPVQPPFRSDAFQVENADAPVGPRLIEASELDGSLRFTDPRVPAGINLHELAGLQRAQNVIVVSQTGEAASKNEDGDPITTIQAGLDAVPDGADVDNPWLVLVAPGLYFEDILWVKDGVELRGLSRTGVRVRNLSANSTIRVLQGLFTTPLIGTISNMTLEHVSTDAAVELTSSTFASGSLTFAGVPLPGDTFDVNGTVFTAVAAGTVPGPFEFELGANTDETAENAATAIADPLNGLVGLVLPSVSGSILTLRALNPGIAGNAITLASSAPLVIVISGPTFTNGMDTMGNSIVAANNFLIKDCNIVVDNAPANPVLAAAVNNIELRDCSFEGSAVGSLLSVSNCARLRMTRVPDAQSLLYTFDTGAAQLPTLPVEGLFLDSVVSPDLQANLTGGGTVQGTNCRFTTAAFLEDVTMRFISSEFTTVNVGGTTNLTLERCTRINLVAVGTLTVAEDFVQGEAVFPNVDFVAVVFDAPQPNLNYQVLLESELEPAAITDIPFVRNRTLSGFEIAFPAATLQTTTVRYVVQRNPLV